MVETDYPMFDVDGEEEPLFADDLDNLDDDPPPLPPPMPSLSQLSQRTNSRAANLRVNSNSEENFGGGGATGGDSAGGGGGEEGQEAQKKKRKPLLTLTIDRVFSEKGLPYLEKEFPKLKFKGKGHEATDLNYLLQQYEHWANALYPKLTFKDVTDRIEALASKKEFKVKMGQLRRRSARGGISSPPLSDKEDQDENDTVSSTTNGHTSYLGNRDDGGCGVGGTRRDSSDHARRAESTAVVVGDRVNGGKSNGDHGHCAYGNTGSDDGETGSATVGDGVNMDDSDDGGLLESREDQCAHSNTGSDDGGKIGESSMVGDGVNMDDSDSDGEIGKSTTAGNEINMDDSDDGGLLEGREDQCVHSNTGSDDGGNSDNDGEIGKSTTSGDEINMDDSDDGGLLEGEEHCAQVINGSVDDGETGSATVGDGVNMDGR